MACRTSSVSLIWRGKKERTEKEIKKILHQLVLVVPMWRRPISTLIGIAASVFLRDFFSFLLLLARLCQFFSCTQSLVSLSLAGGQNTEKVRICRTIGPVLFPDDDCHKKDDRGDSVDLFDDATPHFRGAVDSSATRHGHAEMQPQNIRKKPRYAICKCLWFNYEIQKCYI